ncbi:chorismate mutase [Chthonobacter rhizosphaerae]|uniref:chorismate mutase n=1 Tax=Chthonobacter rhizosphaerae TaxID=2735553 RepID=UPI0015EEFE74|nr:chorismate mutase [Chthonobacter rhizosphaerae]
MALDDPAPPRDLADLRARIDAIDAEMHGLLIRRSEIIDQLISVKRIAETGAAFRPAREAAMMHALVDRHRGHLPLVTVEHVWREIISTFTWLQAPYTVHVATGDAAETRDVARFYFGFTVPFETVDQPVDAVAAVARSTSDLAVVRLGEAAEPWWLDLSAEDARPRVIGRLPFIGVVPRPVATPAVVVSMPLKDPVSPEVHVFAGRGPADAASHASLADLRAEVLAWHAPWGNHTGAVGAELVIAVPADGREPSAVAAGLVEAARDRCGVILAELRPIGGYAAPIAYPAP